MSVGNSLTAGFMDGGLIQSGQMYSYRGWSRTRWGSAAPQFTQWIASRASAGLSGANVDRRALLQRRQHHAVLGSTPAADVQSELLLAATQPTQYRTTWACQAVAS